MVLDAGYRDTVRDLGAGLWLNAVGSRILSRRAIVGQGEGEKLRKERYSQEARALHRGKDAGHLGDGGRERGRAVWVDSAAAARKPDDSWQDLVAGYVPWVVTLG